MHFKLRNLFSVKDSVPRELRSCVIYKFTCACCNACYIGETGRHFSTRVREHLSSNKSSHIFKHLLSSERCRQSCSTDCFEILDSAPTKFQLKLKVPISSKFLFSYLILYLTQWTSAKEKHRHARRPGVILLWIKSLWRYWMVLISR